MSDRQFDERDFERLLEFLAPDPQELTDEEATRLLVRLQIDVQPSVRHLREAIESVRAQKLLQNAGSRRRALLSKLQSHILQIPRDFESLKEEVKRTLSGDQIEAVYWNRLEEANNVDDLQTLLEDVQLLEQLEDSDSDDASSTT